MVMLARDAQGHTYTVVIDGKRVGEVRRPVDLGVVGRARGTVYVERPIHKAWSRGPGRAGSGKARF